MMFIKDILGKMWIFTFRLSNMLCIKKVFDKYLVNIEEINVW